MKEKIQAAIKDMSTKVARDSEHIYRNPETGDKYQGVSTVSSIMPKDWLSAWGAKETVKFLGYSDYDDMGVAFAMWDHIKNCKTVKEYIAILKEAKGASARKSKKALVDGTAGHAWLEDFVKARVDGSMVPLSPAGTPLERPIKQFLDWESINVDHWIASEALVVNPERRYGGQLDAICMLNTGKLCVVDFKFASGISEDYYLQTSAYQACFEFYGIQFDHRIIIRLPKTLEKDEWNPKTFKYKKIPNDIEVFVVPTPYEGDRNAFYAALPLKAWINYVQKITEDRKAFKVKAEAMTPFKDYPKEKLNPTDIPW